MLKINDQYSSPNFDDRPQSIIDFLIFHYTECDFDLSLKMLCGTYNGRSVSAHYLIDQDGTIYGLVPDEKRAWHAGISWWAGHEQLNDRSIGIELVNLGDHPFEAAQMASLIALSKSLIQKHKIPAMQILGHQDIAPDRKRDPGPHFDWKRLADEGIGLYPDKPVKSSKSQETSYIQRLLHQYGYKVPLHGTWDQATSDAVQAFQTRFCPASDQWVAYLEQLIERKKAI